MKHIRSTSPKASIFSKVLRLILLFLVFILLQARVPAHAQNTLDLAVQQALIQTQSALQLKPQTSANLTVASARTVQPIDLNTTAYAVKILDHQTGQVYSYWYDQNLQAISEQQAFERRAMAYQARYGRLSRGLFAKINSPGVQAEELFPVAIWAEQSTGEISVPDGVYKIYLPIVSCGNCLSAVEKILAFLSQRSYTADYVSSEVPVVYANLPSAVILEIQSQPYVAAVYDQVQGAQTMESAARTSAAPWTWSRGITGSGIKVAVVEDDGVAFDNPYLSGSSYYIGWWPRVGDHATWVAGVIASTHSTQRGIAYDAEILSANALTLLDWNVVAATDWSIASGADIINASFGTTCGNTEIQSIDKYFDWVVWNNRKTVTVSSGNVRPECPSNYNVSSPGKAYNVITVGAKDDFNTATAELDVGDDQLCAFSRYVDPTTASENRLKPEVVSVGQRIISTSTTSPWTATSEVAGTSFSAPIVAGESALMMQRASWLKYSPEAVKAGIMASARWTFLHDYPDYSQWATVEKMGVGAIDTTAADNSLINGRIQELYLHQSNFPSGYYDITFNVTVAERIRVVIVWSAHPSRTILNWILHDRLESDFDLSVISPSNQIFGSYADEANYEIVEFMAPEVGQYRARVHLSRWDNARMEEKVGFAWYSGIPINP